MQSLSLKLAAACTFILFACAVGLSHAQQSYPNYRAGAVNILSVQPITIGANAGGALVSVQVRQQLEGIDPRPLTISGASASTDTVDPNQPPIFDLTGEVYATKIINASAGYDKSSLTPAVVQDASLGCRSVGVRVYDRIASTDNKSLSNADFSFFAYFNIVDNRDGGVLVNGSRVVKASTFTAPNYNGPLYFDFPVGSENSIDLKPYIATNPQSPKFTCALQTDKDQNGITNTGLARNPGAPGYPLQVSEDCVVTWKTEGVQLGEKYGFRIIISNVTKDLGCGAIYSTVDLLAQVGCRAGDLSCLQCSNLDLTQIIAAVDKGYTDLSNMYEKLRKKSEKLSKQVARDQKNFTRTKERRERNKFKKEQLARKEAVLRNLSSQPQFVQSCLRPSKLFCQTVDKSHIVQPIIAVVADQEKKTKKLARNIARLRKISGNPAFKDRAKRKNVKIKDLPKIVALADVIRNAVAPLNGQVHQCLLQ